MLTETAIKLWKKYGWNFTWNLLVWGVLVISLLLRVYQLDRFPLDTNSDGLAYAWAGSQLWQNPTRPASMSLFVADNPSLFWFSHHDYFDTVRRWDFRLVSPFLDQPLWMMPLIGSLPRLFGFVAFQPIPEWLIRLPAVLAAGLSLGLTYLLTKKISNRSLALLAMAIYGFTPYFVFAHREAFLENFLTPLYLLGLLWLWQYVKAINVKPSTPAIKSQWYLAGLVLVCLAASLTKVIGIVLPAFVVFWLLSERQYRAAVVIMVTGVVGLIGSLGSGFLIDSTAQQWILAQQASRGLYAASLVDIVLRPEFYSPFKDGWYVLGFIAWFSWLISASNSGDTDQASSSDRFVLTFSVFVLISVLATAGIHNNFPWYRYPLFPILSIAIARLIQQCWQKPSLGSWVVVAGFSLANVHFLSPLFPVLTHSMWMRVGLLVVVAPGLLHQLLPPKYSNVLAVKNGWKVSVAMLIIFAWLVNIAVITTYPTLGCSELQHCKIPEKFVVK